MLRMQTDEKYNSPFFTSSIFDASTTTNNTAERTRSFECKATNHKLRFLSATNQKFVFSRLSYKLQFTPK